MFYSNLPMWYHLIGYPEIVLKRTIYNTVQRVSQGGLKNQLQAQINRPDNRGTLLRIQVPTPILAGRDDPACPLEVQLKMLDALPHATLILLKNC